MNQKAHSTPTRLRLPSNFKPSRGLLLNGAIVVLVGLVGYLAYSLVVRLFFAPAVDVVREGGVPGRIIQVDVLNGCGAPKAASSMTAFLRSRGYDVVEIRNYHRFDVRESLVVERAGHMENAEKVARALGISAERIIQQLNPDEYVDVSVVVGLDYGTLKHAQ